MAPPRFAVDTMLGRLALWLRLLGFDTTYGPHLAGRALVRHARAEGRILLTRNHRLVRQRDVPPCLLVTSDHFRDQLRQVLSTFDLASGARVFSRCSRCNVPIVPLPTAQAAPRVPPYVLRTQTAFAECPHCHRTYWPATHYDRMCRELGALGVSCPPRTGAPNPPASSP